MVAQTWEQLCADIIAEQKFQDRAALPVTICPVCGSQAITMEQARGGCDDCDAVFVFNVQVEVKKWRTIGDP
jgi:ssDNA-binding Zn-finger/Zn-ribbon topoisomerase 1